MDITAHYTARVTQCEALIAYMLRKNNYLAIYGDIAASEILYRLWHQRSLSKVSNANLAEVGFAYSLNACIVTNGRTNAVSSAIIATALEVILGAVGLNGSPAVLRSVMHHLGLSYPLTTVKFIPSRLLLQDIF
ncbi:hypothetical protein GE09DRAFT_685015 [Coniochaeta sp. 2T2.1]|nr:hypothetical protein GE09DRAFT_685015 [Coniochaeta sp. 2T2.1]